MPGGSLADDLIALAGTPDEEPGVPALLRSITQFAADLLQPVSYASMTVQHQSSYATVAMSSEIVLAIDEAQYEDGVGPCLEALQTHSPTVVPRIDATVRWPGFRDMAFRLGLRASLSIPLFAGRGTPIAALNLYGHDVATMATLSAAVVAAYERSPQGGVDPDQHGLGPRADELVNGLIGAFAVRATIQQALGILMAAERTDADGAYEILRSRATASALSLTAAAGSILNQAGDEPRRNP
jgi:hypothetical protein